MSTWAQPGRLRRPGRGLKTVEKSANSQFSNPPHTQKFGHPHGLRDADAAELPAAQLADIGVLDNPLLVADQRSRAGRGGLLQLHASLCSHVVPRPEPDPALFRIDFDLYSGRSQEAAIESGSKFITGPRNIPVRNGQSNDILPVTRSRPMNFPRIDP